MLNFSVSTRRFRIALSPRWRLHFRDHFVHRSFYQSGRADLPPRVVTHGDFRFALAVDRIMQRPRTKSAAIGRCDENA
jgi:hypothetical protein